jgi:hypothetical protein
MELPNSGHGFGFSVVSDGNRGTRVHSILAGGIAEKVREGRKGRRREGGEGGREERGGRRGEGREGVGREKRRERVKRKRGMG